MSFLAFFFFFVTLDWICLSDHKQIITFFLNLSRNLGFKLTPSLRFVWFFFFSSVRNGSRVSPSAPAGLWRPSFSWRLPIGQPVCSPWQQEGRGDEKKKKRRRSAGERRSRFLLSRFNGKATRFLTVLHTTSHTNGVRFVCSDGAAQRKSLLFTARQRRVYLPVLCHRTSCSCPSNQQNTRNRNCAPLKRIFFLHEGLLTVQLLHLTWLFFITTWDQKVAGQLLLQENRTQRTRANSQMLLILTLMALTIIIKKDEALGRKRNWFLFWW